MDVPQDPQYKEEFELAQDLAESSYEDPETGQSKPCISLGSLRDELEQLPRDMCSHGCIDFLEYLLVIDPTKRPTAKEALQHPFVMTAL
jgi:serine/threonine protein kinase